jgi:putative Mg2+ transporter-C (MgtC) family protein
MSDWWQRFTEAAVQEVGAGLFDPSVVAHAVIRLLLAAVAGGLIGWQREHEGKSAGLRTHMLVALGTALFVLASLEAVNSADAVTRVVQGVATGSGFIGGGVILKRSEPQEVRGLTTAAGLWMTAAVGVAMGIGRFGLGCFATLLAMVVLGALHRLERKAEGKHQA